LQRRSLNPASPVFVTIQGRPVQVYEHWFNPAASEACIRDFVWYGLRQTFASRLVMARVDLRTVTENNDMLCTLAPAHRLAALEHIVFRPAKEARATQAALIATRIATSSKVDLALISHVLNVL
jgi:hypothetical protein